VSGHIFFIGFWNCTNNVVYFCFSWLDTIKIYDRSLSWLGTIKNVVFKTNVRENWKGNQEWTLQRH
jgi:hypothetical protein